MVRWRGVSFVWTAFYHGTLLEGFGPPRAPRLGEPPGRPKTSLRVERSGGAAQSVDKSAGGKKSMARDEYVISEREVDEALVGSVVRRHLETVDRYDQARPVARHTADAFAQLVDEHGLCVDEQQRRPLIVDACCGAARSTITLAEAYPDHLVVGVDRSAARLSRATKQPPANAVILRAELGDFWRLLARSRVVADHTYLLYPNPYPKREHLMRRWHGHPVFPFLLQTSNALTVRASWHTYLDEFAFSVRVAADVGDPNAQRLLSSTQRATSPTNTAQRSSIRPRTLAPLHPDAALTHFEAKYAALDLPVYELAYHPPSKESQDDGNYDRRVVLNPPPFSQKRR